MLLIAKFPGKFSGGVRQWNFAFFQLVSFFCEPV